MNPYLLQVPIYVPLPLLLQAHANYLSMLQKSQQEVNSQSFHELEGSGVSAYSLLSFPPDPLKSGNKDPVQEKVVISNIRKAKKVAKPWHLPSHKLFRNAIFKQIYESLHEPQMAVVLNRLMTVGCDVKKFAFALESNLYYSADRLEDYLEYTTLKKRICEEIKKTKKVYI